MSEMEVIMKFEFLPNEILLQCFGYLHGFEIFFSFDELTFRFSQLIRSIPLHINFENIQKATFDQFCMKIKANPKMQQQIYSLKLSNNETLVEIDEFFRFFTLNEFIHLQSLTLTDLKANNVSSLKMIIPLMSELTCFHLFGSHKYALDLMAALFTSPKKRRFLLLESLVNWKHIEKNSTITKLTLPHCQWNDLHQILKNAPMLKYFNVNNMYSDSPLTDNDICISDHPIVHLKQLMMNDFSGDFLHLKALLQQTPNLKLLTISAYKKKDMINASHWEHLITTSLSYLNTFKFEFSSYYYNDDNENTIIEKLKEFQNDFWQDKHHWYTEYLLSAYEAIIYTIPYFSIKYQLRSNAVRYCNSLMNNDNTFTNVENLKISTADIADGCPYHFLNVRSLTIIQQSDHYNPIYPYSKSNRIESLKKIVNLSNVQHLTMLPEQPCGSMSVLRPILNELPHLFSITMLSRALPLLLNDDELCKHLNKTVKKIVISRYIHFSRDMSQDMKKFGEKFSNLQQLCFKVNKSNDVLFLLNQFSQLSYLQILVEYSENNFILRLQEELLKLNKTCYIEKETTRHGIEYFLWINKKN